MITEGGSGLSLRYSGKVTRRTRRPCCSYGIAEQERLGRAQLMQVSDALIVHTAHRMLDHFTQGSGEMKKKKKNVLTERSVAAQCVKLRAVPIGSVLNLRTTASQ